LVFTHTKTCVFFLEKLMNTAVVHQQCGMLELTLLKLILRVVLIFLSKLICLLMSQNLKKDCLKILGHWIWPKMQNQLKKNEI
jgi:hypothetical protein